MFTSQLKECATSRFNHTVFLGVCCWIKWKRNQCFPWPVVDVETGGSWFLLSSVGIWENSGWGTPGVWRWSSLAPSGAGLFTQFLPHTCTTAWGWCCLCFISRSYRTSVSALEILILSGQGRTCQPVNLYPSPLNDPSLVLFHALSGEQTPQDLFDLLRPCYLSAWWSLISS